ANALLKHFKALRHATPTPTAITTITATAPATLTLHKNPWRENLSERVHRMVYPAQSRAINDMASWIELRYNHVRLHSALVYRNPDEVEREFLGLTKAA
ncbi:hypothetical protein, partial [Actinomyces gerencseriae]